jgi:hypothetical protein
MYKKEIAQVRGAIERVFVCDTYVEKVLHENQTRHGFLDVTVAQVKTKLITGFTFKCGAIRSRHCKPQQLRQILEIGLNDVVLKLLYGAVLVQIE